jgi:hypothetical protein
VPAPQCACSDPLPHSHPPRGCLRDFSKSRVMDLPVGPKLGEYMVMGGLGVLLVDPPEGQDIIGCMRQSCNHGCRACLCPKTANDSVDAAFPIRTYFSMDKACQDVAGATNKTQATAILREHGLHERDFLFADLPLKLLACPSTSPLSPLLISPSLACNALLTSCPFAPLVLIVMSPPLLLNRVLWPAR